VRTRWDRLNGSEKQGFLWGIGIIWTSIFGTLAILSPYHSTAEVVYLSLAFAHAIAFFVAFVAGIVGLAVYEFAKIVRKLLR
jgi:hypothetical protein